ncbi:hypothetical protein ACFXDE_28885 [Kitasatospora sp. NPDC059408]|uniref:hypothetical protein n=1 Tax=Kitasatospora sp. NPDC059408 TaxID=3346823 RepID=UPI0036CE561E
MLHLPCCTFRSVRRPRLLPAVCAAVLLRLAAVRAAPVPGLAAVLVGRQAVPLRPAWPSCCRWPGPALVVA